MKTRRSFLSGLSLAVPGLFLPRKVKAALPGQQCTIVTTLVVLVIVLGIAIWVVVNILKACNKLDKKINPPDPDNDDKHSFAPPGSSGSPINLVLENRSDATCKAWDISEAGYLDPEGYPYCVMFEYNVQSCDSLLGSWTEAAKVVGYVSASSVSIMEWAIVQGVPCYHLYASGQQTLKNLKVNVFKNGACVGHSFTALNNNLTGVSQPINVPAVPSASKFFRFEYEPQ